MYLLDSEHPQFPLPAMVASSPSTVVAIHGNLEAGSLLTAYSRGLFPWFMPGDPLLWHSPDPRMVLAPTDFHISRRLRRTLRQRQWRCEINTCFDEVINGCADRDATWITAEMATAYRQLHHLGHAHCLSVHVEKGENGSDDGDPDDPVGGVYGVGIGRMFFAESMFSRARDASKVALAHLCAHLTRHRLPLIDCQVESDHLTRLGARPIPRKMFLSQIQTLCAQHAPPTLWNARSVALDSDDSRVIPCA